MSLEATLWAMCLAPVPVDVTTRRPNQRKPEGPNNVLQEYPVTNAACGLVLIGLANCTSRPDGMWAYPSVELLMLYTRLGERGVRNALDRLEADGLISRSEPGGPADAIRADRRPISYDLNLGLMRRDDLTDDQLRHIGRANPIIEPHIERMIADRYGVHGQSATGCSDNQHGVQPQSPRGAARAPEPLKNLTTNRKAEPTGATRPSKAKKSDSETPEEQAAGRAAAALVKEWHDNVNHRPPGDLVGHASRLLKRMLVEGVPYDAVRTGLAQWVRRGDMSPSMLPAMVNGVMNGSAPILKPSMADRMQETMNDALRVQQRMEAKEQKRLEIEG